MNVLAMMLLQSEVSTTNTLSPAAAGGMVVVWLALVVVLVAAMWKVFVKAGQPGWAAIVPIYNLLVLLKIAGKPAWWLILMFIPFVNFIVIIIAMMAVARNFGKGAGFGLGLTFLSPIFFPILGFGDARYQGQVAS